MKTKLTKLEKLKFLEEKFPVFYKSIEEAKLAADLLWDELNELTDKIEEIREKLDEVESLREEIRE